MATKRFKRQSGRGGFSPSVNQKITQVNARQGIPDIGEQQGTTRVIMDAVPLLASAVPTVLTLFEGCKTRQWPFTNLTENKLQRGESIALERMSLFLIEMTSGSLTAPLGVFNFGYFAVYERLYTSFFNFNIAQDQVIKKLPCESMKSEFNPDSRWMGMYQSQINSTTPVGDLTSHPQSHEVYHFNNDLIIPEMIEFTATIQIPPITLVSGADWYLAVKLEGLGSLYAPKGNY